MKKNCFFFAMLFASISVFSQSGLDSSILNNGRIAPDNSLQKGSWAAQFEIGSDFKLSSFEGVTVSLKYHFSPKAALRLGVGLNGSMNSQRVEFREYYYGYSGNEPVSRHSHNVFLTTNFLYYLKHDSKINVFVGIGPRVGYINNYFEYLYIEGYLEILDTESWAAGLNGVFGCEWFPVSYLSLFAEYSAYGIFGKTIKKNWIYEISTGYRMEYYNTFSNDYEFRGNIAKLGLAVYF